jgi:hypothetical protein
VRMVLLKVRPMQRRQRVIIVVTNQHKCSSSLITPFPLHTHHTAQDHEHLGSKGDIVEVAAGHARHHLFPNGEADYAVPSVIKSLKVRGWASAAVGHTAGQLQCPHMLLAAADHRCFVQLPDNLSHC